MENHPVPQNISSYEFRLVGDMTLKQFLQLAAGILGAVLLIRLDLLPIIKYPLAFISFILGFAMAFVPINGRPFTSWFVAFIKAVYSPTEFIWIPEYLLSKEPSSPPPVSNVKPVPVTPSPVSSPSAPGTLPINPVSTMIYPSFPTEITSPVPKTPAVTVTTSSVSTTPPKTPPPPPPAKNTPLPSSQLSAPQVLPHPDQTPVINKVAPTFTPNIPAQYASALQMPQISVVTSAPKAPSTSQMSAPTSPNILCGLITDSENLPLSGTTVEIVDIKTGIPARALRTNKLGQFQIAIPLPPGPYNVVVEKEGFTFNPVSVQIKGNIVPPVIISGKKA